MQRKNVEEKWVIEMLRRKMGGKMKRLHRAEHTATLWEEDGDALLQWRRQSRSTVIRQRWRGILLLLHEGEGAGDGKEEDGAAGSVATAGCPDVAGRWGRAARVVIVVDGESRPPMGLQQPTGDSSMASETVGKRSMAGDGESGRVAVGGRCGSEERVCEFRQRSARGDWRRDGGSVVFHFFNFHKDRTAVGSVYPVQPFGSNDFLKILKTDTEPN